MNNTKFIIKILILTLIVSLGFFGTTTACYAHHATYYIQKKKEIQQKKRQTHAKVIHLKFLENLETNKLYKNQERLDQTSSDLESSKAQYTNAETKLSSLESNLSVSLAQFSKIDAEMKSKIRRIFKTQRKGFFELLLSSQDFNSFLDRVYFEGIVIKKDYREMMYARQKAREIAILKYRIQEQKRVLSRSIEDIKSQNASIQQEIAKNQDMIQRLRTDRRTYENAENDLARQSNSLQAMIERRQSTTTYTSQNINVSAGFIKPINGRITSPFGWRVHPIFRSRSFHSGVDIAGPYRGNVRAANSGRVIYASWYGGYGKVVILDHGRVNGIPTTTLYAHLNSWNVSAGQYVSKGQVIGFEGTTGYSTGPHVHFEVRLNGRPHNPLNYI